MAGNRISTNGMGAPYPLASNTNEAGRQQNRRVEIEIIPNPQQQQERQQGDPND